MSDSAKVNLFEQIRANTRLQWMLLAVLIILLSSGLKAFIDGNSELYNELNSQQNLSDRLQRALNTPINDEALTQSQQNVQQTLSSIPKAPGQSVAEAQALSEMNKIRETLFTEGRANLIGTEQVQYGGSNFYQTRVELSGNHDPKKLISLLDNLDGSKPNMRLMTFQLRAGRRVSSLTLVLDYLHVEAAN